MDDAQEMKPQRAAMVESTHLDKMSSSTFREQIVKKEGKKAELKFDRDRLNLLCDHVKIFHYPFGLRTEPSDIQLSRRLKVT